MNAVQIFEPDPEAVYGIDVVAQLVHAPKRTILVYCKHGLVSPMPASTDQGYTFDAQAVRDLLRIESLRQACDNELTTLKFMVDLINEVQRLRRELQEAHATNRSSIGSWNPRGKGNRRNRTRAF